MQHLLIEDRGAVRILTLNRPAKHNALNTVLTQELLDSLRAADRDPAIHAVVLTGAGKSFCAGADTTEFSALTPEEPQAVTARADLTTALHLVFSQMNKPVISAVRGNALGGGAGLAIACDLAVMSETVRFGYPELKHGIVAAVVMANLVRQVGRKQAFELVALAEPLDGPGAKAMGLCNRVVPDAQVLETALQMAQTIAGWSPVAMATTKRSFHRVADLALGPALEVGRDANVMMRGFRKAKEA
ncbi:enoyl-CoA hydratase/isomerase family protein [Comamonas piscis]|uniref:Enoyl-CoA hydratase/isomerase family protein n=1 Tax=Comamonas piscis TaxID=1562974 RepID=A0A7G5EL85_9BURK|nr:enoyl-CoA hydratase/isomerase family protein [Comamonas piscis]QMV74760.1 enoyl-CoA hydratase/isomerase family protein [Comamonas piscis]WSO33228.1 enoyl-CoA hydratase/isomerase family protein [Comamonas piscis]